MRMRCLTVQDGHLHMDGHDVAVLGRRLPTPFFLYSESQVRWNIERLRNAFTRRHLDTEVFFASKACSNLWFLDLVRRTGINVEVNSGGELWKALKAGFQPSQIGFNGAGKTRAEIAQAVAAGIRAIVVDSVFELETIAEVAAAAGASANVSLRVDVDVATSTHPGLSTTHGGKAGIDLDDAPAAFRFAAGHTHLALRGLHLHIGSQIVETAPYALAVERALDIIERAEADTGMRLEHLNAGGGMAVPYRDKESRKPMDYFVSTLTADDYAAAICDVLERRRPDLKLFIEPGRSIAADAGILVARVQNEKVKGVRDETGRRLAGEDWLVLDAGFNTFAEPTSYDWHFDLVPVGRADEATDAQFRLAGPLCDGGDVFPGDDETPYRRLPAGTGWAISSPFSTPAPTRWIS